MPVRLGAEEWSGWGSRDIDGQAGRPNEQEANESISRYLINHGQPSPSASPIFDPLILWSRSWARRRRRRWHAIAPKVVGRVVTGVWIVLIRRRIAVTVAEWIANISDASHVTVSIARSAKHQRFKTEVRFGA